MKGFYIIFIIILILLIIHNMKDIEIINVEPIDIIGYIHEKIIYKPKYINERNDINKYKRNTSINLRSNINDTSRIDHERKHAFY